MSASFAGGNLGSIFIGGIPIDQRRGDLLPLVALGAEVADAVALDLVFHDRLIGAILQYQPVGRLFRPRHCGAKQQESQAQQQKQEILQNGSEVNQSKKKNVLRSAINPAAGAKQSFELKGAHAKIQAHSGQPVLYVDIDEGASDIQPGDRFRVVRTQAKNDVRVVGNLKVSLSGKTSEESTLIATTVEKVGKGQWLKVTPAKELLPGEYALVEMLGPQEMNLYVWDFGVNPQAPANPNVWRPSVP